MLCIQKCLQTDSSLVEYPFFVTQPYFENRITNASINSRLHLEEAPQPTPILLIDKLTKHKKKLRVMSREPVVWKKAIACTKKKRRRRGHKKTPLQSMAPPSPLQQQIYSAKRPEETPPTPIVVHRKIFSQAKEGGRGLLE